MGKDVSGLREKEAQQERERVAKLRIQEQAEREKKEESKAQQEAEARKKAAQEAKKREEELVRLRQERKEAEKTEAAREIKEVEEKKEGFKETMKETQIREEQERRRFLERVAAKAREEGEETSPPPVRPTPPPLERPEPPPPPKPKTEAPKKPEVLAKTTIPKPEIPRPTSPKDEVFGGQAKPKVPRIPKIKMPKVPPLSLPQSLWAKIVLSLLTLAIFAAVGTFWYWYFAVRGKEPAPAEEPRGEEMVQEQSAEETEEPIRKTQAEIAMPEINEMILGFGYYIPESPRIIDTIVIHTVYNALGGNVHSLEGVLDEYEMYGVAAHYLIDRDGTVYQTAPEEAIAYHAGPSQMPDGRTNVNNFSIGIEAINYKDNTLTKEQYISLAGLVKHLKEKYQVPDSNIVGHSDIAPERKTDPWNFDWEYFRSLID